MTQLRPARSRAGGDRQGARRCQRASRTRRTRAARAVRAVPAPGHEHRGRGDACQRSTRCCRRIRRTASELADAFERIQKPQLAAKVLEGLAGRPRAASASDERMRLAWLLDSTGRRDDALERVARICGQRDAGRAPAAGRGAAADARRRAGHARRSGGRARREARRRHRRRRETSACWSASTRRSATRCPPSRR